VYALTKEALGRYLPRALQPSRGAHAGGPTQHAIRLMAQRIIATHLLGKLMNPPAPLLEGV
jgi:hypothetical protein